MSRDKRKRESDQSTTEHREGLRKVIKSSSELQCPICDVTLRAGTLPQHYQQELERLQPPTAATGRGREGGTSTGERGRRASSHRATAARRSEEGSALLETREILDGIKRKRFLFNHPQSHDQPGPSHLSSSDTSCDVCGIQLPSDGEQAAIHVSGCQGQQSPPATSDSEEEYEEYTWCNVTRVRATSMLSAETRANIFNGTVVSTATDGDSSFDVDVEDDSTSVYGPPQYSFADIARATGVVANEQGESSHDVSCDLKGETHDILLESHVAKSSPQCLICMDTYTQPLVSVQCWHVFCEQCWLQALGDKKLCPKCKTITCAGDLRRIFL